MVGYKELKNLQGRIVLITGASSGMGEQIAYQAAKKGAIVIGCARRIEKLEEVVATCRRISGNDAYAFQVDVSIPNQIERVVETDKEAAIIAPIKIASTSKITNGIVTLVKPKLTVTFLTLSQEKMTTISNKTITRINLPCFFIIIPPMNYFLLKIPPAK